jgi:hypothetical protein
MEDHEDIIKRSKESIYIILTMVVLFIFVVKQYFFKSESMRLNKKTIEVDLFGLMINTLVAVTIIIFFFGPTKTFLYNLFMTVLIIGLIIGIVLLLNFLYKRFIKDNIVYKTL